MSKHYERAKEIFLMVCDLPVAERAPIIERECAANRDLRAEVFSLLAHHDAANQSHPPKSPPKRFEDVETAPRASFSGSAGSAGFLVETGTPQPMPERIGNYRIIRRLGAGGMGIVYLAARDDDQFKKRVAIKVIKKGMDSDEILRRFEQERQVLSALNHANIARMLDGGSTEDGRPYFVMEYIEGMPINEYADKNRLRIEERLDLFRTLCNAVHHAHANLIVHRDIKPSNVVVTGDGTLKLLDFGIAKLLNPDFSAFASEPTATSLRLMTPEYASPEQVRGDPISTASDVYSLGVLLYELVTGRRPYRFKTRLQSEIERIICTEDPERPSTAITHLPPDEETKVATPAAPGAAGTSHPASTVEEIAKLREAKPDRLRRRLSGDIDNIVLMAMRKEPRRRYTSAEQFGDDIRRHLDGLPVIARPMTFSYRFNKFVLRNRAGVAAAAVIALMLIGWAVSATVLMNRAVVAEREAVAQARIAEEQRQAAVAAEQTTNHALRVTSSYLSAVSQSSQNIRGPAIRGLETDATEARLEVASKALEFYNEFAGRDIRPSQADFATAYLKLGDLQGGLRSPNVGKPDLALQSYTRAIEILKELVAQSPDRIELRISLADAHIRLADVLPRTERGKRIETYQEAIRIADAALKVDPANDTLPVVVANACVSIADLFTATRNVVEAEAYLKRADEIRSGMLRENPDDPKRQREAAIVLLRFAELRSDEQRYEEAQEMYDRLLAIRRRLYEADSTLHQRRRDLAIAYWWCGTNLADLRRWAQAREALEAGRTLAAALHQESPVDARVQNDLALILMRCAEVEIGECDSEPIVSDAAARLPYVERARTYLAEAAALFTPLAETRPTAAATFAGMLTFWGRLDALFEQPKAALDHYFKAKALYQKLSERDGRYEDEIRQIDAAVELINKTIAES